MLPYDQAQVEAEFLLENLKTPHALTILCDLNGQHFYTMWANASTSQMATFALSLIETMIEHQANDDEILEAYALLKQYIQKQGGLLRPVKRDDFTT